MNSYGQRRALMKMSNEDEPTEPCVFDLRSPNSKRLYLEAVLAEYKRLTDERMVHSRNMDYLFAVMVGGIATIIGFSKTIGTSSLLMFPIFIASCSILILQEGYTGALIENYVIEKVVNHEMREVFGEISPIRWEAFSRKGFREGAFFWLGLFALTLIPCLGSLAILTANWSEVCSDGFFQLLYFFGWMILAFYILSTVIVFSRLGFFKALVRRNQQNRTGTDPGQS